MILQAGSVDITNLNTRVNATEHFDFFNQETIRSADNLFKVAEYWHERSTLQSVAVRGFTGNDLSGPLFLSNSYSRLA